MRGVDELSKLLLDLLAALRSPGRGVLVAESFELDDTERLLDGVLGALVQVEAVRSDWSSANVPPVWELRRIRPTHPR